MTTEKKLKKLEILEIIEETLDYYIVKDKKGKITNLKKISEEEISKIDKDNIENISNTVGLDRLDDLIDFLEEIKSSKITIEDYYDTASLLTVKLTNLFFITKSQQIKYYIKYIDPGIYGNAQTFQEITNRLLQLLNAVKKNLKEGQNV